MYGTPVWQRLGLGKWLPHTTIRLIGGCGVKCVDILLLLSLIEYRNILNLFYYESLTNLLKVLFSFVNRLRLRVIVTVISISVVRSRSPWFLIPVTYCRSTPSSTIVDYYTKFPRLQKLQLSFSLLINLRRFLSFLLWMGKRSEIPGTPYFSFHRWTFPTSLRHRNPSRSNVNLTLRFPL